ncbi:MAG: hypothetical protein L0Y75_02595, partial [Acidobacteria bacterium]|nr:hypothetical protein [Acidobacteriota bacterium]
MKQVRYWREIRRKKSRRAVSVIERISPQRNTKVHEGVNRYDPDLTLSAIPGLAILPGFLIMLFGSDACKLLILQEPVLAEFPNRELLSLCPLLISLG